VGTVEIAARTEAPATAPAAADLVSVVIAVHDGERFLRDAIDSVLSQTGVELELVVVDDGSTDATGSIVREAAHDPRVTGVHLPARQGVSGARNHGIAHTRGPLVAFLDADDVFLPGKLRRQRELFTARPELVMAMTSYVVTDARLQPRQLVRSVDLRRWALLDGDGPLLPSTSMVRRSALAGELRFDERFSTVADIEFALRVARLGATCTLREPLTCYRRHDQQMSSDLDTLLAEYPVLAAALADAGLITDRERRRGVANLNVRMLFRTDSAGPFAHHARRCLRGALAHAPTRLLLLPLHACGRRIMRHVRPRRGAVPAR
jgi:glycosyltransferase involved in cell wall biosynthesis